MQIFVLIFQYRMINLIFNTTQILGKLKPHSGGDVVENEAPRHHTHLNNVIRLCRVYSNSFTYMHQFHIDTNSEWCEWYECYECYVMCAMSATIESGEWLSCNDTALTMLGGERSAFGVDVIHICV